MAASIERDVVREFLPIGGYATPRIQLMVGMLRIHESLNESEQHALDQMREWASAQGSANEHITCAGKLAIAQRLLNSGGIGPNDVWKAGAIGVLLGDALEQAMEKRLSWVIAEDELGPAFALSWKHTEALVYPLSAIRSRLRDGIPVDVHSLFSEYSSVFPFRQR